MSVITEIRPHMGPGPYEIGAKAENIVLESGASLEEALGDFTQIRAATREEVAEVLEEVFNKA